MHACSLLQSSKMTRMLRQRRVYDIHLELASPRTRTSSVAAAHWSSPFKMPQQITSIFELHRPNHSATVVITPQMRNQGRKENKIVRVSLPPFSLP